MSLEERIRRLERANRRLVIGATGGAIALVIVFGLGAAESPVVPDTLRARAIKVVDGDGTVRARLSTQGDGGSALYLYDTSARRRVGLLHDDDQTALYLYDGSGDTRVGAAQFAHGGGGFALHGPDARGSAVLYYKEDGSLTFFDADGKVQRRVAPE